MHVEAPGTGSPLTRSPSVSPERDRIARPGESPTYYDLPVVKAPPWKAYIPVYFYAGGAAGAAGLLATAAQLAGRRDLDRLARRCHWIAAIGEAAGGALLIADLGRPQRFLNMMRVFRPTSPMNIGTWILAASGATSGLWVATGRRDVARRRVSPLSILSGVSCGMLTSYTAVLLSNTAVPLWTRAGRRLPLLFAASSAASAASLLDLIGPASPAEAAVVRRFGLVAGVAELAAAGAVERELVKAGLQKPLRRGLPGALWRAAGALRIAALAASILPGSSRRRTLAAGLLGTAAGLAMRFAVFEAGKRSAADPRATFEPQRERRARRERLASDGPAAQAQAPERARKARR